MPCGICISRRAGSPACQPLRKLPLSHRHSLPPLPPGRSYYLPLRFFTKYKEALDSKSEHPLQFVASLQEEIQLREEQIEEVREGWLTREQIFHYSGVAAHAQNLDSLAKSNLLVLCLQKAQAKHEFVSESRHVDLGEDLCEHRYIWSEPKKTRTTSSSATKTILDSQGSLLSSQKAVAKEPQVQVTPAGEYRAQISSFKKISQKIAKVQGQMTNTEVYCQVAGRKDEAWADLAESCTQLSKAMDEDFKEANHCYQKWPTETKKMDGESLLALAEQVKGATSVLNTHLQSWEALLKKITEKKAGKAT